MSRPLRILFFGFNQVGLAAFKALRDCGRDLVGCYTRDGGDGSADALRQACQAAGIECRTDLPAADDAARHRSDRIDLIVSAGYPRRIAAPLLATARLAAINVTPAPLPKYRGRNPIAWGLFADEQTWALTVHAITPTYNEGAIFRSHPVVIKATDNAWDLATRCAEAAGPAIDDAIERILDGAEPLAQDVRLARTFTEAVPFGGAIDWRQDAGRIASFVRALDRGHETGDAYRHLAAPAAARIAGIDVGLWRARAGGVVSSYPPGTITRCDDQVWVQTGRGHLAIEKVLASGQDFDAAEFFAARSISAGDAFETAARWSDARRIHARRVSESGLDVILGLAQTHRRSGSISVAQASSL